MQHLKGNFIHKALITLTVWQFGKGEKNNDYAQETDVIVSR